MWQKYNKTKYKYDKIPKDKTQKWQYTKRQNTYMTLHKKIKYKLDKTKKDKIQIWQNSKRQNTNVTKHKKTDCKYDKIQKQAGAELSQAQPSPPRII